MSHRYCQLQNRGKYMDLVQTRTLSTYWVNQLPIRHNYSHLSPLAQITPYNEQPCFIKQKYKQATDPMNYKQQIHRVSQLLK